MKKFKWSHLSFIILLGCVFSLITQAQTDSKIASKENKITQKTNSESVQLIKEVKETSDIIEDDLIHPGDIIEVDVLGSTEYDWRGTITPEGFLDKIEFTENDIFGLCQTERKVAEEVEKTYGRFLKNPKVVVTILDRSNRPLSTIFGAVKLPQRLKIKRKINLDELIVLSGGFTEKASGVIQILRQPNASCVEKLRREKELSENLDKAGEDFIKVSQQKGVSFIYVEISDLLNGMKTAKQQILYGDTITIFSAEPVYIIGGVVNPTKISLRENMSVTRAIASAGGLTNKANPQSITVFRRKSGTTQVIKVNLKEIEEKTAEDLILEAYDIIDVAENGRDDKKYPPVIRFDEVGNKQISNLPIRIID